MNIFLVTSPFQYICANEARVSYQTTNNVLILEVNDSKVGISQLTDLVNISDWEHIIYVSSKSRTITTPRLIKKIIRLSDGGTFEHFFFAEYNGWRTNLIKRNINFLKHVYFDDGTATLFEYDDHIKYKKTYHRPRALQDFLVRAQGCKKIGRLEYNTSLEMFSIFDITDPVCNIKKNTLAELRKKIYAEQCYDSTAPVGIIGQGAVGEKGHISVSDYIEEIAAVTRSQSAVIYFPHRSESVEVTNRIKFFKNITYHHSEKPLEFEIADKKIKLSHLYGIASTALYTMSIIYKEIPISTFDINSSKETRTSRISEYLRNHFN